MAEMFKKHHTKILLSRSKGNCFGLRVGNTFIWKFLSSFYQHINLELLNIRFANEPGFFRQKLIYRFHLTKSLAVDPEYGYAPSGTFSLVSFQSAHGTQVSSKSISASWNSNLARPPRPKHGKYINSGLFIVSNKKCHASDRNYIIDEKIFMESKYF